MTTLRLVSLFTGAGGLDFGFEAAGFETAVAVEFDSDCCATLRANRRWPVVERDIRAVSSQEILDVAGARTGEIDVVVGGPPCQPFSKSAYWASGDTRRLHDPRASTLDEYMRVVSDLLPRVFVLENVHGIAYSGKEEGFLLLARMTDQINRRNGTAYALSWKVLDAASYGVPQIRRRFFLVARREGGRFRFPDPTHREDGASGLFELPSFVTSWDAIGRQDLIEPGEDLRVRGRWGGLLASIPEGENYSWHTSRKGGLPLFGWRRRFYSCLLKLAKNRPAWTIQAQPGPAIGPFHWDNRQLSVREMAALQTFPSEIRFTGLRRGVQKQLGNAVPSLLAEVLAREIAAQFFGAALAKGPNLAVQLRRPIPPAEPVAPVPDTYMHLRGEHPAHPGTGRGYAASRRSRESPRTDELPLGD